MQALLWGLNLLAPGLVCQPPARRCLGEGSAAWEKRLTTNSEGRAVVWKNAPPKAVVMVCSKPEAGQDLTEPAEESPVTKVH